MGTTYKVVVKNVGERAKIKYLENSFDSFIKVLKGWPTINALLFNDVSVYVGDSLDKPSTAKYNCSVNGFDFYGPIILAHEDMNGNMYDLTKDEINNIKVALR